ncbi:hypothetical protein WJX73_009233 [Symbiochloris irregularis]|uniref:SBP-type domain-containing protein n=1 Tax=Symbiochloris irregularis TaxID=706552 RepID=A0AAW1NXD3_9CHLO
MAAQGALGSLEDLVLAGDHSSWNIEDWKWDPLTFTAAPPLNAEAATYSGCNGAKRLRLPSSGAQTVACHTDNLCRLHSEDLECELISVTQLLEQPGFDGVEQSSSSGMTGGADRDELAEDHGSLQQAGGRRSSTLCQVEGCGRLLTSLSIYHQRCHICEVHIKMPAFQREGRLQRFCQRCGRCHEIGRFDGKRRSCREQLEKHNARRRRRAHNGADPPAQQQSPADTPVPSACQAPAFLYTAMPAPSQVSSFDFALQLMGQQGAAAVAPTSHTQAASAPAAAPPSEPYQPVTFVSRLSVKLFNCTPRELPVELREQLTTWLHSTPAGAEGYIRAGCVLLTVDLLMHEELIARGPMQQLVTHLSKQQHPLHLAVEVEPGPPCCQSGRAHQGSMQTVRVQLPDSMPQGLAWLEVHRGALISAAHPLVVLPDPALAQELAELLQAEGSAARGHLLIDLGVAVSAAGQQGSHGVQLATIAAIAHRLLPKACDAGAPGLTCRQLQLGLKA